MIPASWAALEMFLLWTAGLLVFPCREHRTLGLGLCLFRHSVLLSFYRRLRLSFQHQPEGISLSRRLLVLVLFGQPELDVQFLGFFCAKKDGKIVALRPKKKRKKKKS